MSYCVTDGDEPAKAPEAKKKLMASASLCTVARDPLSHTCAFLARPSPLQLNTVVGELLGLLPTLRLWLGRDHFSTLCVVPDVLHPDGEGARTRDARVSPISSMLELIAVARRL